ncbi:MAG: Wzt carbohydrate-binding domain-containing protein, partial [Planctomycetes bacterium]|nr:Wzt carbohydrate-binding domain-containing protein [Planctomycetota bacterium]
QGVAVLYVSHDAMSLKHLCDRVAWIDGGRLQQVGEPSPVVDAYLNDLFHGIAPPAPAVPGAEQAIAADDDQGSQEARFVRCQLLDERDQPTEHVTGGSPCRVHLRLRNEKLPPDADKLVVGFSISDVHGIAVTGVNTISRDVDVPLPAVGDCVDVDFRFAMPKLVPGNYAITVTAVTLDRAGETHLLHLLQNALAFDVSSHRKVFGMLGLDCEVTAAPARDQASR